MKLFNTIRCSLNAYIALFVLLFTKKRENIWLIGGHNGKLYTDNAKVFYEYILDNHPTINIYWVVAYNAPVSEQIKGKKLIKGSMKAYLYFYHAKVTLFSDTLNSDIAPYSFILPYIKKFYAQTFKVYLSHGTIAFKKMPTFKGKLGDMKRSIFYSYDLAIASTSLAKKAMLGYNINPSALVLAGSARHDVLKSITTQERTILVAPTWRSYLPDVSSFSKSDFLLQYRMLLSDKKLHRYLHQHQIKIHFYLHHMFHQYSETFEDLNNGCIKILTPDTNIAYEIMSAEMMITDYSSICSDFYYMKKPVLFFQFDQKKFMDTTGSEIDLAHDVFGHVSYNTSTLIETLIETLEHGTQISNLQKEGEKYFMHFHDTQNCQRIYNAIKTKI